MELLAMAEQELRVSSSGPITLAQQWIVAQHISGGSVGHRTIPLADGDAIKSPVAPSFVETALVLRLLLCVVSITAEGLLILSYPKSSDTPADTCRDQLRTSMYSTLYTLLRVGVLSDTLVLFIVIRTMRAIWNSMLKGAAVVIVRERVAFFSIWRMALLYGVAWAPVCLVMCASLSMLSGEEATCSISDDMWRAWPSASIIILTVMSVFTILWALFWLLLRIVIPQFRLALAADTRTL